MHTRKSQLTSYRDLSLILAIDQSSESIAGNKHTTGFCCHTGSLTFGPEIIYISTGDNVNPFESDGYSRMNVSRYPYDARVLHQTPMICAENLTYTP
jgi:hypothetical protein